MTIPAIGAIGGAIPLGASGTLTSVGTPSGLPGPATALAGPAGPTGPAAPTAVTAASAAPAGGFETTLVSAIDNLQALQTNSDVANIQAVTSGNLADIQDATIAAARVQTTVQLVAAVRNQAVNAFNQIMQMGA